MSRKKQKKSVVVLSVDQIAKRANEVVADVDLLVAQIKAMVDDHEEQKNGY